MPPIYDGARYQPSAKPGHRAPHFQVGPGTPLLDVLGPGFTLLDLGAGKAATEGLTKAAADKGVPLELVATDGPRPPRSTARRWYWSAPTSTSLGEGSARP